MYFDQFFNLWVTAKDNNKPACYKLYSLLITFHAINEICHFEIGCYALYSLMLNVIRGTCIMLSVDT